MLYLYDPISNVKTATTYDLLTDITGLDQSSLYSMKCRRQKIRSINSYLVDDNTGAKTLYGFMCKEKLNDEIWKDIDGSEKYQISSYGRVRKKLKNDKYRLLRPYIRNNKWLFIKVVFENKLKECAIHKLVGDAFIENEHNLPCLYHKDENRYNNRADNLAWISREDLGRKTAKKSNELPVIKIDPVTNEVIEEYQSMAEAGRLNYLNRETIRQCVRGRAKTAGGFKWRFDTEFATEKQLKKINAG